MDVRADVQRGRRAGSPMRWRARRRAGAMRSAVCHRVVGGRAAGGAEADVAELGGLHEQVRPAARLSRQTVDRGASERARLLSRLSGSLRKLVRKIVRRTVHVKHERGVRFRGGRWRCVFNCRTLPAGASEQIAMVQDSTVGLSVICAPTHRLDRRRRADGAQWDLRRSTATAGW